MDPFTTTTPDAAAHTHKPPKNNTEKWKQNK